MLKRHEVEILLKAGHCKAEVARLAGLASAKLWPSLSLAASPRPATPSMSPESNS